MKQGEESRLDRLNAAYLSEEPPVRNMTMAGLEAWQKAQPVGSCSCVCIGKIDNARCKTTCPFFCQYLSCSTGLAVHTEAALGILEEKLKDNRLKNYVVIRLADIKAANPVVDSNAKFQELQRAVA